MPAGDPRLTLPRPPVSIPSQHLRRPQPVARALLVRVGTAGPRLPGVALSLGLQRGPSHGSRPSSFSLGSRPPGAGPGCSHTLSSSRG